MSNPTLANIHYHKTYKKDLKKLKRSAKYYKNILGINYSNPKKNKKKLKIAEYKSEMNCPPECYTCHNQR